MYNSRIQMKFYKHLFIFKNIISVTNLKLNFKTKQFVFFCQICFNSHKFKNYKNKIAGQRYEHSSTNNFSI